MPRTNLYINVQNVGFTPSGGSLQSLTKITQVAIAKGSQSVNFSGDGDRFSTFRANVMNDPTVSFTGGDLATFIGSVSGTYGTLTFTIADAKNVLGIGAATFTLVNAMVEDSGATAAHAALGTGTLEFSSYSSDGTTNPLSYVLATS